jgi:hypothetical protein
VKVFLLLLAMACMGLIIALTQRGVIPVIAQPPLTPLQERVRAALQREAEGEKADAALPNSVKEAEIGVTTTIVGPGTSWPCASSKLALRTLMKWQKAMLDERSPDSVMNNYSDALLRTRSIMVWPRTPVKILDKETGIRKVRVFGKAKYSFPFQAETAQSCWVAADAVVR